MSTCRLDVLARALVGWGTQIRLMQPPNATWQQIIEKATQNPEVLKAPEVVRNVQNILQTNCSVASSLGPPFLSQMSIIYVDMLNVYRCTPDRTCSCTSSCQMFCVPGLDASDRQHVQQTSRLNNFTGIHACVGGDAVSALLVAFWEVYLAMSMVSGMFSSVILNNVRALETFVFQSSNNQCVFCVYRMYSELISSTIATGGPHAAKTSAVKLMRSVKKVLPSHICCRNVLVHSIFGEVPQDCSAQKRPCLSRHVSGPDMVQVALRLIETFVKEADDHSALIAEQFVPAMMDPILGDYHRNVPDARCKTD